MFGHGRFLGPACLIFVCCSCFKARSSYPSVAMAAYTAKDVAAEFAKHPRLKQVWVKNKSVPFQFYPLLKVLH